MNQVFKLSLLIFIAALIQGYFLSALGGASLTINLVLLALVFSVVQAGLKPALWLGFWGGFWLDVMSASAFGLNIVWYMVFASLFWLLIKRSMFMARQSQVAILVFVASLLYQLSLLVAVWLDVGQIFSPAHYLFGWLVGSLISSALIFVLPLPLKAPKNQLIGIK